MVWYCRTYGGWSCDISFKLTISFCFVSMVTLTSRRKIVSVIIPAEMEMPDSFYGIPFSLCKPRAWYVSSEFNTEANRGNKKADYFVHCRQKDKSTRDAKMKHSYLYKWGWMQWKGENYTALCSIVFLTVSVAAAAVAGWRLNPRSPSWTRWGSPPPVGFEDVGEHVTAGV